MLVCFGGFLENNIRSPKMTRPNGIRFLARLWLRGFGESPKARPDSCFEPDAPFLEGALFG